MHSLSSPVAAHERRDRLVIASCILGIAAIAWAYLVHLSRQMSPASTTDAGLASMAAMSSARWDAAQWSLTFIMWAVMMVGMMSPSAAPTLVLYAQTQSRRAHRGAMPATVAAFVAGYLAIWVAFSVVAATTQWAAREATLMSPAMRVVSPRLAGIILIVAGLYQLTPAKRACLAHCQSPLGFLMSRWRDGAAGALAMGARHGVYCLGCCWALMVVLFAVGVMNLAWVAGLATFVLIEKIGWPGPWVARLGGAVMILMGARLVVPIS